MRGSPVVVLGGGVAGLAFRYYASILGLECILFEATERLGGICVTHRWEGFRFDSGAHRIHGTDPHTVRDLATLLGNDLGRVDVQSAIWDRGRLLPFPFGPADLAGHLGARALLRTAWELVRAQVRPEGDGSFAAMARRRYGATVSERFLLNYTEKLWGQPCERLSPEVSGRRLQGLGLGGLITRGLGFCRSKGHVEGAFFYPRGGIGMLTDALATAGSGQIATGARAHRVLHDGTSVWGVQVGEEVVCAERVVSTIPLDDLVGMLDPPLDELTSEAAARLSYRHVVLVALFLDTERVTTAATVYFPGRSFPFTRVVEPRNRSRLMAPEGKTSLVAEIPCGEGDDIWTACPDRVVSAVVAPLERILWVNPDRLIGAAVERLPKAYPVATLESAQVLPSLRERVTGIRGLYLLGRNATFRYAWIHELMREAKAVAQALAGQSGVPG